MGEALRYELAPLGIDSVIVEPGRYETDFHSRSLHHASDAGRESVYGFVTEGIRTRNANMPAGDAMEVVDVILRLIDTPRGERATRTFIAPGGADTLSGLNTEQSTLQRGLLSLFGNDAFVANGT
jgi:NAD(P)-dependent dehydrogenase (short-subunit alcohol dehydrogenase family)